MRFWLRNHINWQTSTATHIGGRDEQQDRSAVIPSEDGNTLLVVIADGMGGLRNGAEAAQAVIDTAHSAFHSTAQSDPLDFLARIFDDAHRAINTINDGAACAPGSTCVLLLIKGETAYWAHIGDSRLYHFRGSKLLERTKDHSVAQVLVEKGTLPESELVNSPLQNQLHRRLGGTETPTPDFSSTGLREGDTFLLCSDGLWGTVHPEENIGVLKDRSLEDSAIFLSDLAMNNGGATGDNISLALVTIETIQRPLLSFWGNSFFRRARGKNGWSRVA